MELNDELLFKYIDPKFESCCHLFCEALEGNDQQHIVKYIMSSGQEFRQRGQSSELWGDSYHW